MRILQSFWAVIAICAALIMAPAAIAVGKRSDGSRTHRRLISFRVTTPANGETDTLIDLPANCRVMPDGCCVEVLTAEATGLTKNMDVGLLSSETGGDADGFMVDVPVSSTGIKTPTRGALVETTGAAHPHNADSVTAKSISISVPNAMSELDAIVYIEIEVLER